MKNLFPKKHSLIDKVYAVSTLRLAYAKGARRGSAPGADGVTWKYFRRDLPANLEALSCQIRTEQYSPLPFRVTNTTNYSQEPLVLCIPSVRDRVVEHAIRIVLEPIFEANIFAPFTAGYRPGRSRVTALRLADALRSEKLPWVTNIEIEHLAESADHARLLSILETYIADGKILRLIEGDWQSREGLPNGSALTPFLCNVYLHAIDDRLRHMRVVRFSNTYLMFHQTREEARQALVWLMQMLREHHLAVKPRTTGIAFQPQLENLFLFDGFVGQDQGEALDGIQ